MKTRWNRAAILAALVVGLAALSSCGAPPAATPPATTPPATASSQTASGDPSPITSATSAEAAGTAQNGAHTRAHQVRRLTSGRDPRLRVTSAMSRS